MDIRLTISLLIGLIILVFVIIAIVRKGRISVKYSFVWLSACLLMFIFLLIPGFLRWVGRFVGILTVSNLVFTIIILLLIFINISITIIISGQSEKIRLLIQEVSILKEDLNDIKDKNEVDS